MHGNLNFLRRYQPYQEMSSCHQIGFFRSSSEGITVGDDSEKAPLPRIHVLHPHLPLMIQSGFTRATLLLELWLEAKPSSILKENHHPPTKRKAAISSYYRIFCP
nr:hypothetical protein CFP56_47897 [Quercus suber]